MTYLCLFPFQTTNLLDTGAGFPNGMDREQIKGRQDGQGMGFRFPEATEWIGGWQDRKTFLIVPEDPVTHTVPVTTAKSGYTFTTQSDITHLHIQYGASFTDYFWLATYELQDFRHMTITFKIVFPERHVIMHAKNHKKGSTAFPLLVTIGVTLLTEFSHLVIKMVSGLLVAPYENL